MTTIPSGAPAQIRLSADHAHSGLVGGIALIEPDFRRAPEWGRVAPVFLREIARPPDRLAGWAEWARSLRRRPVPDRLLLINVRVNQSFDYREDIANWGIRDYWESPEAAVTRGSIDCEGFAIFKMWLAWQAGVPPADMLIMVGVIPSTGQPHALLLAADGAGGGPGWLLDNRSPYLIDPDLMADFEPHYSVNHQVLLVYTATTP